MFGFDSTHGWLYEMHGGPADGMKLYVDSFLRQTPSQPPSMDPLIMSGNPEGVYRPMKQPDRRKASHQGEKYVVWIYRWELNDAADMRVG